MKSKIPAQTLQKQIHTVLFGAKPDLSHRIKLNPFHSRKLTLQKHIFISSLVTMAQAGSYYLMPFSHPIFYATMIRSATDLAGKKLELMGLVNQDSQLLWSVSGVLPPILTMITGAYLGYEWTCQDLYPLPATYQASALLLASGAFLLEAYMLKPQLQGRQADALAGLVLAGLPLIAVAFSTLGLGLVSVYMPLLQAGYLLGNGSYRTVKQVAEMIGDRSTEQVSNEESKEMILRNHYIKTASNIKAVKQRNDSFRFSCHVAFDIPKVIKHVQDELSHEAELANIIPFERRDLHKAALLRLIRKVPSRVLSRVRDELSRVQNTITEEYPNCKKIDLQLQHSKELQTLTNDEEEDIRIIEEEVETSDFRKMLLEEEWLREEIDRRYQSAANSREWFQAHTAREIWKEAIAKDEEWVSTKGHILSYEL